MTAASAQRSAYDTWGCCSLNGCSKPRAIARPAFAPCALSPVGKRCAPRDPPVPSFLLYVPESCHARRTRIGLHSHFATRSERSVTSAGQSTAPCVWLLGVETNSKHSAAESTATKRRKTPTSVGILSCGPGIAGQRGAVVCDVVCDNTALGFHSINFRIRTSKVSTYKQHRTPTSDDVECDRSV